jgi:hypothetical protein
MEKKIAIVGNNKLALACALLDELQKGVATLHEMNNLSGQTIEKMVEVKEGIRRFRE